MDHTVYICKIVVGSDIKQLLDKIRILFTKFSVLSINVFRD